jgi:predicted O-methyltransferase YrrM
MLGTSPTPASPAQLRPLQYKIGPEKGRLLEAELQQAAPSLALEVGTFLGYSAIRTARHLQPQGRLVCIEANPQNAAVARQVLAYAGIGEDRVLVLDGLSSEVIPQLPRLLQQQQQQQQEFDFLFLDHCKSCYLPDLQLLEGLGVVRAGTKIMADNVIYPGAPGELRVGDRGCRHGLQLGWAPWPSDAAA